MADKSLWRWFTDRENRWFREWFLGVMSVFMIVLSAALILSNEPVSGALFLTASIPVVIYFYHLDEQRRFLAETEKNPHIWLTKTLNPLARLEKTLDCFPAKRVRMFRQSINVHIPVLIADFGESLIASIFVGINEYCARRERPDLSPLDCRKIATEEFKFLYKTPDNK